MYGKADLPPVIMVKTSPLQMPIWALILSLGIAAVFLAPCGTTIRRETQPAYK
jgi:hypothetical protein